MQLIALLVFVALGLWWIGRSRELFLLSARRGRVLLVRGRIPPGLLRDMRDVLENAGADGASVRGMRSEGGARLVMSGVDEATAQRLRNTFGMYPIARLAAAPSAANPTLGQVLGLVWLAWLLDRGSR